MEVIRAAYKTLSNMHHPDKNPGDDAAAAMMQKINGAYRILRDPQTRASYDEALRRARSRATHEQEPPKEQERPSPSPPAPPPRAGAFRRFIQSWWPILAGVISVKLLGVLGAGVAVVLYYWLRPKTNMATALLGSGCVGVAVSFAATSIIQRDAIPVAPTPVVAAPQVMEGQTTPPEVSVDPSPVAAPAGPSPEDAQRAFINEILAVHPDAIQVFQSPRFKYWLTQYPSYVATAEHGTAREIVAMFSQFKAWDAAEQRRSAEEGRRAYERASKVIPEGYRY